MDVASIRARVADVPPKAFDDFVRRLYTDATAGRMTYEEAAAVHEAIEERRRIPRPNPSRIARRSSIFPPRRPQKPTNRGAAIERRRRVMMSGALPPAIASRFTPAEIAALSIVAWEVRQRGRCDLALDAVAAMAGCSRSTAKNALRRAAADGLLTITVRPIPGRKNATNVVEITDRSWSTWLRRAGPVRRGQTPGPHDYPSSLKDSVEPPRGGRPSLKRPQPAGREPLVA